jgi:hypothetical protein
MRNRIGSGGSPRLGSPRHLRQRLLYLALVCLIFTAPNIDWRGLHQGLECDFALQASPAVEVMGDGPPGILDASMDYASALRCYNYY